MSDLPTPPPSLGTLEPFRWDATVLPPVAVTDGPLAGSTIGDWPRDAPVHLVQLDVDLGHRIAAYRLVEGVAEFFHWIGDGPK